MFSDEEAPKRKMGELIVSFKVFMTNFHFSRGVNEITISNISIIEYNLKSTL